MYMFTHTTYVTPNQHKILNVQNFNTLTLAVCKWNLTSPVNPANSQFPKAVVDALLCALMLLSLLLICQSPHPFLIVYLLFPKDSECPKGRDYSLAIKKNFNYISFI